MEILQPAPGDSDAVNSARTRLGTLIGDDINVVIVARPTAPAEVLTRIGNAEGAGPGRFAVVASPEVLGDLETQWFGNDGSVVAVILRGARVVGRISQDANQFVINRAVLGAEAI